MPVSAPTPCRHAGCNALVKSPGYCSQHQKQYVWQHSKPGTTTQRGYGAAWRKLRKLVIERDSGLCCPCRQRGILTEFHAVDHVMPKAKGGTDALSNLQCICKRCHQLKTSSRDNRLA